MSHFPGQILGCAYTICSHGQIQTFCTIPSESLCPPSFVKSYTLSALTYCDRSFQLYRHITYICYFVASCLFCFDLVSPYGVVLSCYQKRFTFSLLRLLFLSHVQVFLSEISLVCCLKCPYNCFSSHFCFLVIFVPLMIILSISFLLSVFLCIFIYSFSFYIDVSTLS